MRIMNCRSVWREIEQAEPDELLSAAVRAHIAGCAACEKVSAEQSKLQTIISSLGTVEAPGDFDFRLRARLAGERRGKRAGALNNFSFGLRAAAVACLLLLVGAAFVFVTFKTRPGEPANGAGKQLAVGPGAVAPTLSQEKVSTPPATLPEQVAVGGEDEVTDPKRQLREPKRRGFRNAVAFGGNRPDVSKDESARQAQVLKAFDEATETYPSAAFPINASYQSLKVSVNDGKGASRTISLPAVSFGSQQALSQSGSPMMASARGVW